MDLLPGLFGESGRRSSHPFAKYAHTIAFGLYARGIVQDFGLAT